MLVIGGSQSPGSLCWVHCGSSLLPVFSSRSPVLFSGSILPPLIDAVVGGVGMYSYSIIQVTFSYGLFVFCHSNFHLVSAMYTLLQSLHGTWYATSFFSLGVFCFTLKSSCFRLLWGLKWFCPRGAQAFSNLSLGPRTKGRSVGSDCSLAGCCS